jgi:hypothetical protein
MLAVAALSLMLVAGPLFAQNPVGRDPHQEPVWLAA